MFMALLNCQESFHHVEEVIWLSKKDALLICTIASAIIEQANITFM